MGDGHRRAAVDVIGMRLNGEWLQEPKEDVYDIHRDDIEVIAVSNDDVEDDDDFLSVIEKGLLDCQDGSETDPFNYIDIKDAAKSLFQEVPIIDDFNNLGEAKTVLAIFVKANFVSDSGDIQILLSLPIPVGTDALIKDLCKKLQDEGGNSNFADQLRDLLAKESNARAD